MAPEQAICERNQTKQKPAYLLDFSGIPVNTRAAGDLPVVGLEPTRISEFSAYLLHFLNSQVTKIVTKIKKSRPLPNQAMADSTQKERNQNPDVTVCSLNFAKNTPI